LNVIEGCLALSSPRLARREAEVCARILYGMTSLGIALDLGIGEESAMTYRKRAYNRLNIGSQRELLLWYLDQWASQRAAGISALH
jgi:DNA-binding CsgD family transcriptional regulator